MTQYNGVIFMKAKSIAAVVLLIVGLLMCFGAAGAMDAGAGWVEGAIRGAVGIIFTAVGVILGKDIEFEETNDNGISEWRDAP